MPSLPVTQLCVLSGAVGLLSHILFFIRGHRDKQALRIIIAHALAFVAVCTTSVSRVGLWWGMLTSWAAIASYVAALFASIVAYRVFFHRLSRFPGPLAAKITRFYTTYLAQRGPLHLEQAKLFDKYGDIVRIAPNELLIRSSDAVQKVHGSQSSCRKRNAGVYDFIHYKGSYNLDSILDREEHRPRRQIWERAMTTRAIQAYERTTREVCRSWIAKADSLRGEPLDSTTFAELIAYDNMGKVGFGYDLKTVEAGRRDHMLQKMHRIMAGYGQVGDLVWPLGVFQDLGIQGEGAELESLILAMADRTEQAVKDGNEEACILKYLIDDFHSETPKSLFNRNILYADSTLIPIAATDTLAVTLSYSFYHLAKHQHYQSHLYNQIAPLFGRTIPGELSDSDLLSIELLDAIINETLRLDNPNSNNAPRRTPPEGITVDNMWIPGGCSVRVPGYALQRSQKAFVDADAFIPERWTTRPEMILDRAAFLPFLAGPNNCVGKRLAMMMLRLVISYTVFYFRLEFAPGEDGMAIYREVKNHVILKAGPLMLTLKRRT